MWILVAFALTLLVALALLWPYLRPQMASAGSVALDPRLLDLYGQRDMLYRAIRDARFDLDTGKLSTEDYATQTERLKHQAAEVLRSIDQVEETLLPPGLDERIEASVAALRGSVAVGHDDGIEAAVAAARGRAPITSAHADRFCAHCGAPLRGNDRFCGQCGKVVMK